MAALAIEDEIRTRLARHESLRREVELATRQLELLDGLAGEKHRARETLEAVTRAKKGDEALLPLGANAFLPVQLTGATKVLKGIGANLATERTIPEAVKELEAEIEEVEGQMQRVAEHANRLQSEAARVQAEVEALSEQAEAAAPAAGAPAGSGASRARTGAAKGG